jgi:hypothetical protein
MDRDLYSAYLATAIDETGEYCANQLSDWSGQEAVLCAAWYSAYKQGIPATDAPPECIEPEKSSPALSGLHAKREAAGDVNRAFADVIVNAKTRNAVGTSPDKVSGPENAPYGENASDGERESGRGNDYQLTRTP